MSKDSIVGFNGLASLGARASRHWTNGKEGRLDPPRRKIYGMKLCNIMMDDLDVFLDFSRGPARAIRNFITIDICMEPERIPSLGTVFHFYQAYFRLVWRLDISPRSNLQAPYGKFDQSLEGRLKRGILSITHGASVGSMAVPGIFD